MKAKLTVTLVESIAPGDKDAIVWDTELLGFGCKVTPKGRRSYFLYYRTREGQQRRPTIGLHGPLRPESARRIARSWLADVAHGDDPSLSRSLSRTAPTVRELCARYISEHAEVRKKASSTKGDQRLIDLHILPALGSRKAASVSRSDIAALHLALRATPYEANRTLALLSTMFRLAERWSVRTDGSNPATNVRRFKEAKRERYLAADEVSRLWNVLAQEEAQSTTSASAIAALRLLLLTGRRLNEVLTLKWSYIDFETRLLRLPDTKSGALQVALGDGAITVLASLKAKADAVATEYDRGASSLTPSPFVIVGRSRSPHLVNLQKPWRRIRGAAGLEDVRIHDLRHSFASVGAGLGMSLPMLGRLLGHTQVATTSRYAHLAQDPVRVAADAIGAELMRMTAKRESPG